MNKMLVFMFKNWLGRLMTATVFSFVWVNALSIATI